MTDGPLPLPRGPRSVFVRRTLRAYRAAHCTPHASRKRRSYASAIVDMNVKLMNRLDLAHCYAGVREILESGDEGE